MSIFAVRAIAMTVPHFSDPCFRWGSDASSRSRASFTGTGIIRPGDPCQYYAATSETKTEAVVRLSLVPGVVLFAAVLGTIGVLGGRATRTLVASVFMLLEAVPLVFTLAPLAILTGGALLAVGLRQRRAGVF
jgi:hypothetical protein